MAPISRAHKLSSLAVPIPSNSLFPSLAQETIISVFILLKPAIHSPVFPLQPLLAGANKKHTFS